METTDVISITLVLSRSSQPTYKEWKRGFLSTFADTFAEFPAYLQGMETSHPETVLEGVYRVPSLPTRNGNTTGLCGSCPRCPFPAYLQGMETVHLAIIPLWLVGSQPTYKEWKLGFSLLG